MGQASIFRAWGLGLEPQAWLIPIDGLSLQIPSSSSASRSWAQAEPGLSLRLDPSLLQITKSFKKGIEVLQVSRYIYIVHTRARVCIKLEYKQK